MLLPNAAGDCLRAASVRCTQVCSGLALAQLGQEAGGLAAGVLLAAGLQDVLQSGVSGTMSRCRQRSWGRWSADRHTHSIKKHDFSTALVACLTSMSPKSLTGLCCASTSHEDE